MALPFELRRAARSLWRYPGITILATLALGLGIGLPTAMFSIVDAAVIRGLPVAEPQRLMHLERRRAGTSGEGTGATARDYNAWTTQQKSFAALGAFRTGTATLRVGSNVDRWPAAFVTPGTFAILGAHAEHGRALTEDDARPGATPSVVLSFNAWRDRYGSATALIGKAISVDGVGRTVVGVMPPGFRFPSNEDAWLPMTVPSTSDEGTSATTFDVIGALRPGISREAARAEFVVIARRAAAMYPTTNAGMEVTVKPFAERFMGENATSQMYVILFAVLLVLVVACANVANLLLVRAVHRGREVALSMALGASRSRIVRQLLMESLLLALPGGAVGLIVANLSVMAMTRAFVSKLPYWVEPRLDARVLLFALVLTVAAAILAAVIPALRISRGDLSRTMRDDSSATTSAASGRIMRSLVIIELALSMGLMVNSGLLSLSADRARHVEMGIPRAGVLTARVSVPESYSPAERVAFFQQLEQRIQNDPSVAGVGAMSALPGTHASFRRIAVEGVQYRDRNDIPAARFAVTSPAALPALHVVPVRGRLIESHDNATNDLVVVVNERYVKKYLHDVEPIGHRIRIGTSDTLPWRTIVGVVPNLWMGAFDASPDRNPAGVYVPLAQEAPASMSVAVRVRSGPPLATAGVVRAAAFAINPEVPIYDVRDIPQIVDDGTWFYGMAAVVLAACGAAGLLLATVGVYGVIAFSVSRRRREFGVRMALGADAVSIVRLVMGQGLTSVGIGIASGAVLAVLLARGVGSMMFEVSPSFPAVYVAVGLLLAVVAFAAMLAPTLAAASVTPTEALRAE